MSKVFHVYLLEVPPGKKNLIDSGPKLKLIGRGGVGMDNIDVDYAKSKNIHIINTPAASSSS